MLGRGMMLAVAAAMGSMISIGGPLPRAQPSRWSTGDAPMTFGYKGAGISMAQQQRASRKAKNVKRHRAASRG